MKTVRQNYCSALAHFTLVAALVGILLIGLGTQAILAAARYSKTIELPPLRISLDQLQYILSKANTLIRTANVSALDYEEVEIRDGDLGINISGIQLDPIRAKLPKSIDTFEYTAALFKPTSVSKVHMALRDYQRTLTVEGQSPEQVDGTFSAIKDDLMKLSNSIGGPMFRVFFGLPALAIGGSLLLHFAQLWLQTRRNNYLLPILIIACLAVLVIVLPIQEMLAGFSAINGDPSIAVRYGPEIALLSLIIAIVAIPLSLLPLWTQKSSPAG
jgi:hypothetical protein